MQQDCVVRFLPLLGLILLFPLLLPAQAPPATREEFEKAYRMRIKQEYLNGVYIPKDIEDAFNSLNQLIEASSKAKFRVMSEEDASRRLHFSFGRWMIVNWGFYEGSRLSDYIRKQFSIFHPDDMARFIIILYHRSMNRSPLNVKELVDFFHEKQEKEKKERLERGTVIHEETRKRN